MKPAPGQIAVIKTLWTDRAFGKPEFWSKTIYLEPSVGEWIDARGVSAVAMDCFPEKPFWRMTLTPAERGANHKRWLKAGIPMIQMLTDLDRIGDASCWWRCRCACKAWTARRRASWGSSNDRAACPPKLCAGLDELRCECLAVTADRRDMRCAEVAGKEQRVAIGTLLQQVPARAARLLRKLAETRVQLWLIDLQRVMDGVAAEQRAFPLVLDVENNMAGGVSGGRLDHDCVLDGVAAVEQ